MGHVAEQDGNGWVTCRCGERHWGLHGAAGLVLLDAVSVDAGTQRLLLQLRAEWVHQGGTWGLPGGARDSHEDAVAAALREAAEEAGTSAQRLTVLAEHLGVDHVDWSYTYVLAVAGPGLQVRVSTAESVDLRWVDLDEVASMSLHPALAAAWPELRSAVRSLLG